MDEGKTMAPADVLISLLKSLLSAEGAQSFGHLILYTSFGVVRGRTGFTFAQELVNQENGGAVGNYSLEVITLDDVTVEHYSNHLPTASFDRFYVRLRDVQGFAFVGLPGQG